MLLVEKNLPANAGEIGHPGSNSEQGRSPGGGHGIPLQNSGLENPINREACKKSDIIEATQHTYFQRRRELI